MIVTYKKVDAKFKFSKDWIDLSEKTHYFKKNNYNIGKPKVLNKLNK